MNQQTLCDICKQDGGEVNHCGSCNTYSCDVCRNDSDRCPVCNGYAGAPTDNCKIGGGGCGR